MRVDGSGFAGAALGQLRQQAFEHGELATARGLQHRRAGEAIGGGGVGAGASRASTISP